MKLIKLPIIDCNMILLDMHTFAYMFIYSDHYIVCAKIRPI